MGFLRVCSVLEASSPCRWRNCNQLASPAASLRCRNTLLEEPAQN